MSLSLSNMILLIVPLLLIEGFFAGSEIALLSADKLNLQTATKRGSRRAKLAMLLASHPERVLSVTLFICSLCVIGTSSLIAIYVMHRFERHSELISVAITSPLIVLFGELIPKTICQRYSDRLATWVAYPVAVAYWVFYPITRILSFYTTGLSRLVGPIEELLTGRRRTTREELRSMLSYGKRESEIKSSERRMIKRIFDFADHEAKHALIPLVRVEAIEDTSSAREALERFQGHRHSRMPVYSERIDNIVGVLDAADLFGVTDLNQTVKAYMSSAHYVAETQSLDDLMAEMSREDNELVVVVDEYGGAVGILTFEDIVEEIVGEIHDEYDSEHVPYKPVGEQSWLAQARMEIQLVNEKLKLDIPEGDYETIGGFLLQQFGRIPETGDELYFTTHSGQLKFTVRKASERSIETVLVERMTEPSSEEEY